MINPTKQKYKPIPILIRYGPSSGKISKMKSVRNPKPMNETITELMRYSSSYMINKLEMRQIIPEIRGYKYKKERSNSTIVVKI
jgi:hypothetical protein